MQERKLSVWQIYQPCTLVSQLLCVAVSLGGDLLLSRHNQFTEVSFYRCCIDSLTHGLIGLVSWYIVVAPLFSLGIITEVIICGLLACLLDVDHFIEAKSLHLENALQLSRRPFLHDSLFTFIVFIILLCMRETLHRYLPSVITLRLPFIFLIAFSSHHIRDAARRGLLFHGFGSTPPFPYWLYIILLPSLPFLLRFCSLKFWPEMLNLQSGIPTKSALPVTVV